MENLEKLENTWNLIVSGKTWKRLENDNFIYIFWKTANYFQKTLSGVLIAQVPLLCASQAQNNWLALGVIFTKSYHPIPLASSSLRSRISILWQSYHLLCANEGQNISVTKRKKGISRGVTNTSHLAITGERGIYIHDLSPFSASCLIWLASSVIYQIISHYIVGF